MESEPDSTPQSMTTDARKAAIGQRYREKMVRLTTTRLHKTHYQHALEVIHTDRQKSQEYHEMRMMLYGQT